MTDESGGFIDWVVPPPSQCGCACNCHDEEADPDWPGPCLVCCEPGDDCDCGRYLARLDVVLPS